MINESIKNFIESLAEYHAENVFNPWADTNPDYEIENAVILRRRQLETYLSRRLSAAKLLLIAEACGRPLHRYCHDLRADDPRLSQNGNPHDDPWKRRNTDKQKGQPLHKKRNTKRKRLQRTHGHRCLVGMP